MDTSYNIGNEMDANMFNQYMYKVCVLIKKKYFNLLGDFFFLLLFLLSMCKESEILAMIEMSIA